MGLESHAPQSKNEKNFPEKSDKRKLNLIVDNDKEKFGHILNIDIDKVLAKSRQLRSELLDVSSLQLLEQDLRKALIANNLMQESLEPDPSKDQEWGDEEEEEFYYHLTIEGEKFLADFLEKIIDRVETEVDFSGKVENLIEFQAIKDFTSYLANRGVKEVKLPGLSACGGFDSQTRETFIFHRMDTDSRFDILRSLIRQGFVFDLEVLFHEYVHSKQSSRTMTENEINDLVEYKRPLMEAQAYLSMMSDATTRQKQIMAESAMRWKDRLPGGLKFFDSFLIACQEIDTLYSLGFNNEQIGKMIEKAKWDEDKYCFDTLQVEIDSQLDKLGLALEDLETISDLRRLENLNFTRQIQLISQEEAGKLLKELQVEN